jgi:hypothetical protein
MHGSAMDSETRVLVRGLVWSIASLSCAGVVFIGVMVWLVRSNAGCEFLSESRSTSPDATSVAIVIAEACSDGGFVTIVGNVAHVVRPDEKPNDANKVFAQDVGSAGQIIAEWLSPQKLQITTKAWPINGPMERQFHGIAVTVKYQPPPAPAPGN